MTIRSRARRGAPVTSVTNTLAVDALNLSRGAAKSALALNDGEHTLLVKGAVHRQAKSGSVVVLLDMVSMNDETPVRTRPLLVSSPGGISDLITRNFEILEALAGLDEGASLGNILSVLTNRIVTVDLAVAVDNRTGQEINEILDVIESDVAV